MASGVRLFVNGDIYMSTAAVTIERIVAVNGSGLAMSIQFDKAGTVGTASPYMFKLPSGGPNYAVLELGLKLPAGSELHFAAGAATDILHLVFA